MILLWNLYLFLIDLIFGVISYIIYVLAFLLYPLIIGIATHVFKLYDIRINGNRPWDIKINNLSFLCARTFAFGSIGILESYFDGCWECKDLSKFLNILARSGLMDLGLKLLAHRRLYNYLRWDVINSQTKERCAKNCDLQYNLGKDFFSMFLDKETFSYSMAHWGKNAKNLQEATFHQMDLLCQKLELKPGMQVLDLGCGFGGFSKYMATKYNVNVVGITNSIEMFKGAKEACSDLSNVQIKFSDYRDLPRNQQFDRIITIEMLFHVGKQSIPCLFEITHDLLKEDGLLAVQDFLALNGWPNRDEAILKYIFPGTYIPRFEEIIKYSGNYFTINNFQDLPEDMEKTFTLWYEELKTNWDPNSKQFDKNLLKAMEYLFVGGSGLVKAKVLTCYHAVFQKRPEKLRMNSHLKKLKT